jgi:hypothetical protein
MRAVRTNASHPHSTLQVDQDVDAVPLKAREAPKVAGRSVREPGTRLQTERDCPHRLEPARSYAADGVDPRADCDPLASGRLVADLAQTQAGV